MSFRSYSYRERLSDSVFEDQNESLTLSVPPLSKLLLMRASDLLLFFERIGQYRLSSSSRFRFYEKIQVSIGFRGLQGIQVFCSIDSDLAVSGIGSEVNVVWEQDSVDADSSSLKCNCGYHREAARQNVNPEEVIECPNQHFAMGIVFLLARQQHFALQNTWVLQVLCAGDERGFRVEGKPAIEQMARSWQKHYQEWLRIGRGIPSEETQLDRIYLDFRPLAERIYSRISDEHVFPGITQSYCDSKGDGVLLAFDLIDRRLDERLSMQLPTLVYRFRDGFEIGLSDLLCHTRLRYLASEWNPLAFQYQSRSKAQPKWASLRCVNNSQTVTFEEDDLLLRALDLRLVALLIQQVGFVESQRPEGHKTQSKHSPVSIFVRGLTADQSPSQKQGWAKLEGLSLQAISETEPLVLRIEHGIVLLSRARGAPPLVTEPKLRQIDTSAGPGLKRSEASAVLVLAPDQKLVEVVQVFSIFNVKKSLPFSIWMAESRRVAQYTLDRKGLPQSLLSYEELSLPPSAWTPEVSLNLESCQLKLSATISSQFPGISPRLQGATVFGFDARLSIALSTLLEGVTNFSQLWESTLDSSPTKDAGQRRTNELKALRHRGLAAWLFVQAFEQVEQARLGTPGGEPFDFNSALVEYLSRNFPVAPSGKARRNADPSASLKAPSAPADFLGKRLVQLLELGFQEWIELFREDWLPASQRTTVELGGWDFWFEDRFVSLVGYRTAVGKLVRQLISIDLAKDPKAGFDRIKVPLGVGTVSPESSLWSKAQRAFRSIEIEAVDGSDSIPREYAVPCNSILQRDDLGSIFEKLLPLMDEGFRLRRGNSVIQNSTESDWQAHFQVGPQGEGPQDASPEGGRDPGGPLDWFALHPQVFFRGRPLALGELSSSMKSGLIEHEGVLYSIRKTQLPSLKRLSRFWETLGGGSTELGLGGSVGGGRERYQLPRAAALEFLALERELQEKGLSADVDDSPQWRKVRDTFRQLGRDRALAPAPDTFKATLKSYQQIGYQWFLDLFDLRLGGVLADDMGLGKTVQTLAFLEALRLRGELGRSLIVVPTSLAGNWRAEAQRFAPELDLRIFEPRRDGAKIAECAATVWVVTYGLLVEHEAVFLGRDEKLAWQCAIFDEAQNLKNFRAVRTLVARKLRARNKFCLTGTPLENHLGELYSVVDLVVPQSLGTLEEFNRRYSVGPTAKSGISELGAADLQLLKMKLKPLVLRRRKSEVLLDLPPKTESRILIPLEKNQAKIYRDIAISWNEKVQEAMRSGATGKGQLMILAALMRLRQACSDPGLMPGVKYLAEPPKAQLLCEAVGQLLESGQSVLIFTQFIGTLERLASRLREQGALVSIIQGQTPRKVRDQIVKEFQDPDKPAQVLLMTLKSGGVGLNLTRASYVFHVEPWWNPAVENQATDRAHRIGQTQAVQVYRYLMEDTVEQKIEILQQRKKKIFAAVLESDQESMDLVGDSAAALENLAQGQALSREDFEFLLT